MADQRKEGNKYEEEETELRRGPWTLEEDTLLIHYIASHGEGRWNHLARCSGLKRTGKSCRLRWLNYLKPDIKRGNLSPEEQFLILELHSKWGNRWSRIAQHLPGRTDNEIKNYWRTRVQKQARQLKIDTNSTVFRDAVRGYWMPRLLEMIGSSAQAMMQSTDGTNASAAAAAIDQPPHGPQQELLINPCMQYPYENSSSYEPTSGSENHSPSPSSASTALRQLPNLSEFPSGSAADECTELSNIPLDSLILSGRSVDSSYGLDALDLAPASAPSLGYSPDWNIACNSNIGSDHSLWSMDELWHIRKLHEWGGN